VHLLKPLSRSRDAAHSEGGRTSSVENSQVLVSGTDLIDQCTRECPGLVAAVRLMATASRCAFAQVLAERGVPESITVDKVPNQKAIAAIA
jgi:hypothetical protein